ncbi:trifunctional dihydropteroate synthetase [Stygiomarasmius scandens]|uniref:2-amino-4-hydroxy-6-hydroxymethyldihydropteridine diphosphokinase n=1 Tax=Marasmiellus scandens TaxID=2682957 RepID=A0ABR1JJ06_9AGAR
MDRLSRRICCLPKSASSHTAVALGSNLGDRFQNIETALRLLEHPRNVFQVSDPELPDKAFLSIVNTSFLYESAPMYVTDQPAFVNCVVLINTNLQPTALLSLFKKVEVLVSRVPSIRNGPRAVDLLLYDEDVVDTRSPEKRINLDNLQGELVVPHPRIREREFVLRPLYNYQRASHRSKRRRVRTNATSHSFPKVPFTFYPGSLLFHRSRTSNIDILDISVPSTSSRQLRSKPRNQKYRTYLMSTLNTTPDSFSDGSRHNTSPTALGYALSSYQQGANILDIGGYSTRPGAAFVSPDEEVNRVVPVVEAIRNGDLSSDTEGPKDMLISLDTFRPEVAEAGILAGANCINDVYAFSGPVYPTSSVEETNSASLHDNKTPAMYTSEMKTIARKYAVPVVLMHSRGDAGSNKDYSAYSYSQDSPVIEAIRIELGPKVDQIVLGPSGVRRWLVIVDPGVGFSKTVEGNLDILRDAGRVVSDVMVGLLGKQRRNPLVGYPQLVGASRKSFLGKILEEGTKDKDKEKGGRQTKPDERTFATAAAVSAAVQQGALVVRVHDVREMGDVVQVADRIWK